MDVACLLQQGHLLGEHGVADLHAVAHRGELGALDAGKRGDNREPDRVCQQVVQVAARVAEAAVVAAVDVMFRAHARRSRNAPMSMGSATITLAGSQYVRSPDVLSVPTASATP